VATMGGLVAREKPSEDRNHEAEDCYGYGRHRGVLCRSRDLALLSLGGLIPPLGFLILLSEPFIRKGCGCGVEPRSVEPAVRIHAQADFLYEIGEPCSAWREKSSRTA
jgi:hypothetical protein